MSKTASKIDQAVKVMAEKEAKYLTFTLVDEEYGISILKIKEIIGMMPITSIPQTPDFIKGVVNLRGKVIPVIDLRLRFGLEATDYTERTCIIVVEISSVEKSVVMGVVVDSVSEVLNIKAENMEETPAFGTQLNTDYILGMAKKEADVMIILDIDKVITSDEMDMLGRVG
jgi:purine-binding chemotaxis protein CheW